MPKLNNLVKRIRSKPFGSVLYGARAHGANMPPNAKASRQASETVIDRLPTRALNDVMSVLVSVQWDRWRFMLPSKPLMKLNVAVVSHDDLDHWHPNFRQKNLVLIPWKANMPDEYALLKNVLRVYGKTRIGQLSFTCLDYKTLSRITQIRKPPHAFWWLVGRKDAQGKVLFIGDMNVDDVPVVKEFVEKALQGGEIVDCVLLPAFGGVSKHGSSTPRELSVSVANLAHELREEQGLLIGALPHPVIPNWSDFNAVRMGFGV
jgi:hypothetical protein